MNYWWDLSFYFRGSCVLGGLRNGPPKTQLSLLLLPCQWIVLTAQPYVKEAQTATAVLKTTIADGGGSATTAAVNASIKFAWSFFFNKKTVSYACCCWKIFIWANINWIICIYKNGLMDSLFYNEPN